LMRIPWLMEAEPLEERGRETGTVGLASRAGLPAAAREPGGTPGEFSEASDFTSSFFHTRHLDEGFSLH
jgi:hypothetical protein